MEKEDIDRIMGVVDHTLLKTYANQRELKKFIDEANMIKTYSVCIHPIHAKTARRYIKNKNYNLKIVVTMDFPLGVFPTNTRVKMLKSMLKEIDEVDFVVQIGYVKSNKFNLVKKDIDKLTEVAHENGKIIKFIVEDAYTTKDEKQKLYEIVCSSKADFIKTSTGFADPEYSNSLGNKTGADPANLRLMAETIKRLNSNIGIKAAGGIHSYQQIKELLDSSGRELDPKQFRLGMSRTKNIYDELHRN